MAYAVITFKNPHTGKTRLAPVGFSWTVMFFGAFPALFRKHWSGFMLLAFIGLITLGFAYLLFMFTYNKMYIHHLIGEGYLATGSSVPFDVIEQNTKIHIPRSLETPVENLPT